MTARREALPPERYDLQHQHPCHARLIRERDAAERHAWDALGRYKFVMFGYWRDLGPPQPLLPNPEAQPLERARGRRPAAPEKT